VKVGILGGTFDPPHIGHLVIAQEALAYLHLSQVVFVPTRYPPHKPTDNVTPIDLRLEMVRLAIARNPRFTLSRVDVDREGPTYTVDTIRLLRRQYGEGADLYFIMGMDSLVNLPTWHKPEELIRLCWLAVLNRPGYHVNLDELEKKLPGVRERVILIPSPALEVSATDLQRRVQSGEPIDHLVPESVAAFIYEHGLYSNNKS
jgi:nicotinate-nucleotide adenylyltransferase